MTESSSALSFSGEDKRLYRVCKRWMDILVALLLLLLFSPLWLAIALLVKLTSPGPILHAARAVGKNGREFTYYKFRSMAHPNSDAPHQRFLEGYVKEDQPHTVITDPKTGQEQPIYKLIDDQRVTPLGRLLRRSSLDEIPQLINVLRGEMSLVGPRPPLVTEYAFYDDWVKARLGVVPGITGLAQVRARSSVPFTEMVRIDLEYIRRRSLLLDLQILLQTIPVVLSGKGAY